MATVTLTIDFADAERFLYAAAALERLRGKWKADGSELLTPEHRPALREMFSTFWPMVVLPIGDLVKAHEETPEMVSLTVETDARAEDMLLAAKLLRESLGLKVLENICDSAGEHTRATAMRKCRLNALNHVAKIVWGNDVRGGRAQAFWF